MSEYDDDKKWKDKLDRAKRDPSVSPNMKYTLEAQVKANEKSKLAKLHREMAGKELREKRQKLQQDMAKKGIQDIHNKPDEKQMIDKAKMQADADKEQGTTEKPNQTV